MSFAARPSSGVPRPPSAGSFVGSVAGSVAGSVGILTPARPNSLNQITWDTADSPSSRKRKRDTPHALTADQLLKAPVVLKPYPAKLTAKPHILHSLMLLPRETLPLSTLDLIQPHGDLPASRFFESHIKILELEGRLGSNVLLARSESSRAVYAIEREGNGLYVVCKLGTWADVEKLGQGATVLCTQRIRNCNLAAVDGSAAPALITTQMHKDNKRKRLAIEEIQSMVRRRSVAERASQSRPSTPIGNLPVSETSAGPNIESLVEQAGTLVGSPILILTGLESVVDPPLHADESLSQPTADDIFQSVRAQYLEALYHSMGSLAYFAKGPLSKARAAFHLDCDFNLDMNDLIDFLKSLVMTTVLIDKKYRETVPDILGKMTTLLEDSDNGASKSKKRKPKKSKLGKDGLYPFEDEHIKKWWITNKPAAVGDGEKTITSTETKYHVSCLRRRETQLQMILILEILALEPLRRPIEASEESQLPGTDSQPVAREESQEAAAKKRNKNNLPVLLDVHADRLCIWQTTMTDEIKSLAESQVLPDGQHAEKPERANSDPLRDFCVDIIVPFFSARLPEICDSINRKLGGPLVQSPPKEKNAKSAVIPRAKPGAPAKRPMALRKDKEKTLERVLSNERLRRSVSRGPSGALALMRSASVTAIPGLKREASEPLLAMIPRGEMNSLKEKPKPSSLFSRSTSSIFMEDSKAKKKAQVDAELKDAISALKKPNRALAVKEIVDEAERRKSTGVSQPKKLKRSGRVSAVQVKATPANNRFKDVLAVGMDSAQISRTPSGLLDSVPSSSSVVPASTAPRKFANLINTSIAAVKPPAYSVQATPARTTRMTTAIPGPPKELDGIPSSSPIMARNAAPGPRGRDVFVPSNRFGSKHGVADLPSSPGLTGLFETPVNVRSGKESLAVNDAPIKSRLPANGGRPTRQVEMLGSDEIAMESRDLNIYQRLGWDTELDEFDDTA
ncbi:DNA replication regulator SLD3-domain-containing protein [Lasiosphaeria hispida]|uniref:DNA replication regulator SLD3-domain-containing protein n=1 Tax=Lasiosphaeria hispida TaxID=260671 RepID=A0AAJ0HU59_9PEZI|nr:DNA replication regulator SLD3-domain-containing protein [Lasiosphaeria hispida]